MDDHIHLTSSRASAKAVFALDVITAGFALILLALATKPTFQRIKERRFSEYDKSRGTPLKTTLGTYLFLWPGLFFFFCAYVFQFVRDLLRTAGGGIDYEADPGLHGRLACHSNAYDYSISVLTFAGTLANVFFATLINGGVWIYSSHITSNSTGTPAPGMKSKIWNTFIMLAILGTGLAAWGLGMAVRDHTTTFSQAVKSDQATRVVYILYRCVVVAASISVSVEVIQRYNTVRKRSEANSPDRPHLARFAKMVVPIIWLRNAFIIYDIVLIFVNTAPWSRATILADLFLLIHFGQFANLNILGAILYGAWQSGRTVDVFTNSDG